MFGHIFTLIGLLTSSYVGLKLFYKIFHFCRVYGFPTYPDFAKYGKWSVVTGATSGIGKEIACQLAARGQNVILIARNKKKLEDVSQYIKTKHQVMTKYLQIDFSEDESIYEKIKEFLQDVDIGVLVNNVGIITPLVNFLDIPNLSVALENINRLNIVSMVKMHQIVLPGMVQRKRGLIVNLSSSSCLKPLVGYTLYGSSKAFATYFSQALSYEYADSGITIQTCIPFGVQTNMTKCRHSYNLMTSPNSYVSSLLASVEKERTTYGSFNHSVQAFIRKITPLSRLHNNVRKDNEKLTETSNLKQE